jgi:Domain of Unknown Function (DUF1259)
MKIRKCLAVVAALRGTAGTSLLAANDQLDGAKIDQITGLKGKLNEKEGVYKVTSPRADVAVAVDGWKMPPFMGLGTRVQKPWRAELLRRRNCSRVAGFISVAAHEL